MRSPVAADNCWATGQPNDILGRTVGSQSALRKTNHGGYNNPEVDALLDQAQIELDPGKQADLFKKIQAIANAEIAIAPLFDQQSIIAYRPYVKVLTQHIAYAPSLETIYILEH